MSDQLKKSKANREGLPSGFSFNERHQRLEVSPIVGKPHIWGWDDESILYQADGGDSLTERRIQDHPELYAAVVKLCDDYFKSLPPVFVFGSNLAGRHGKGAALFAKENRGAIYGKGVGEQGNSYAIPTKDGNLRTLPLQEIQFHVKNFLDFAATSPELQFEVTAIGCGLAGYKPADIAPMFRGASENCKLPAEFLEVLAADHR